MISSRKGLEEAVARYGLLPFFAGAIAGFSIEEMAAPGALFGGYDGRGEGCWEWKGPVIQEMTSAYGKFFRKRAGFVTRELYPDFINYRRSAYPLDPDSIEATLLGIIKSRESATSAELREIIFGTSPRHRRADEPPATEPYMLPRRQALEAPLQRLQMAGRLLIADFLYKHDRHGRRYGWGVALYSTPELWFGPEIAHVDRTPAQSLELLIAHLTLKLPSATPAQIKKLLT